MAGSGGAAGVGGATGLAGTGGSVGGPGTGGAAGAGGAAGVAGTGGSAGAPGTGGAAGAGGAAGLAGTGGSAGAAGTGGAIGTGGTTGAAAGGAGTGAVSGSGGTGGSGGVAGSGGAAGSAGGSRSAQRVATGLHPESVSVAGNGDAFIAFMAKDGVWVQRYTKATDRFEQPVRIEEKREDIGHALIASDGAGGALVTWYTVAGAIWSRRFTAGSTWPNGWGAPEMVLASEGGAGASHVMLDLVMTGSGHAAVAWDRTDAVAVYESFLRVYDPARGWDAPRRFAPSGTPSEGVRLSIAEMERAVVVTAAATSYEAGRDATRVLVNTFSYDTSIGAGVLGASRTLFQPTGTLWGFSAGVATTATGNFLAAIYQRGPSAGPPSAAFAVAGGSGLPSASVKLSTASAVDEVSLSADRTGNAFVVWNECYGDAARCVVRARRRVADAWQTETVLAMVSERTGLCQIALDETGRALAAWTEVAFSAGTAVVKMRRFAPATGWADAQPLATLDPSTPAPFQTVLLKVGADGTGLLLWSFFPPAPAAYEEQTYATVFRD